MKNKWSAVPWALRLQRVVLQGSFASWALLYFRVKLSTLGPLLQGSGAVIEALFSGRALRLRYPFLINKLSSSSALRADSLPRKFIN